MIQGRTAWRSAQRTIYVSDLALVVLCYIKHRYAVAVTTTARIPTRGQAYETVFGFWKVQLLSASTRCFLAYFM